MRKRIFVVLFMTMLLLLTGCSKIADEKKIQSDLETDTQFQFLDENEEIKEIVIEKRQTDKNEKSDMIWCTVTTTDTEVLYQKNVVLTYGLYDQGWLLDGVATNHPSEWIKTPLKGIKEQDIPVSLEGKFVETVGERWDITTNNIKSISVMQQDTNLEEKTDKVTVALTLNADVEEASGQLIINYVFDDDWKIDTIEGNKDFTATVKPEAALEVTEDDLIDVIDKQEFEYGASNENNASKQMIMVEKSEISNFVIENCKSSLKGSEQEYNCSCTLTKQHISCSLKANINYHYDSSNGWNVQQVVIVPGTISVDIAGDWTGTYVMAGDRGEVVLSITEVDDNGNISGIYSWTPEKVDNYRQPGSYYVSGTMNKDTLILNLKAGDWIKKPKNALSVTKIDIRAWLNINDYEMDGIGHESSSIKISQ